MRPMSSGTKGTEGFSHLGASQGQGTEPRLRSSIGAIGPEDSVHWLQFTLLKKAGWASSSSTHGMGSNGRGLGAETEATLPGWSPAFHPKQLTHTGGRRSPAFSGHLAGEDSWVVTSTWFLSGKGRTEGQFSSFF